MKKWFHVILKEGKKAFPPTLFFLVVFHLSLLIRHLDEESFGVTPGRSASATLSALVLGKLYLVLDGRDFLERYREHPLIIGTLWKTVIYFFLGTLALVFEEVLPHLFEGHGLLSALMEYRSEIRWPLFFANHLFLFFWLLLFTAASEFIGVIGGKRSFELFFKKGKGSPFGTLP
jgi:hypothetical protein